MTYRFKHNISRISLDKTLYDFVVRLRIQEESSDGAIVRRAIDQLIEGKLPEYEYTGFLDHKTDSTILVDGERLDKLTLYCEQNAVSRNAAIRSGLAALLRKEEVKLEIETVTLAETEPQKG